MVVILIASIALLIASCARNADSGYIKIDAGIYKIGEDEIYLETSFISKVATLVKDDEKGCELSDSCFLPTMHEYLVAARRGNFKASNLYEFIEPPPNDRCEWDEEELEAEGITGNTYFAGKGSKAPAEGFRVLLGGEDPRDTITSVPDSIYYFWGENYRPSPRGCRCVRRDRIRQKTLYVNAPSLEVRTGRSLGHRVKMVLPNSAQATVIYEAGGWSFIEADGIHNCQGRRGWDVFKDRGWVKSEHLSGKQPAK